MQLTEGFLRYELGGLIFEGLISGILRLVFQHIKIQTCEKCTILKQFDIREAKYKILKTALSALLKEAVEVELIISLPFYIFAFFFYILF